MSRIISIFPLPHVTHMVLFPHEKKESNQSQHPKMNGKHGNKSHDQNDSKSRRGSLSSSVSHSVIHVKTVAALSPNPYSWTEEEVSIWMKHIGYSQYMQLFLSRHVNGEALFALTKDSFALLGIYATGHTQVILNKIQLLQTSAAKYKPKENIHSNINHASALQKSPDTFDEYSQDKPRDKKTYWELWQKIVNDRDFMLESEYKTLLSRSGLTNDDIDMIWKLSIPSNHGRCSFDEFPSIMKLYHLAKNHMPLYIVNVSKLICYHPPLASDEFDFISSDAPVQTMVGFYNLPSAILDSDDRLMEFEKKALHRYHPIHFEIDDDVLMATFRSAISDDSIRELETLVLVVLREQMASNAHDLQLLEKVYLQRPMSI